MTGGGFVDDERLALHVESSPSLQLVAINATAARPPQSGPSPSLSRSIGVSHFSRLGAWSLLLASEFGVLAWRDCSM